MFPLNKGFIYYFDFLPLVGKFCGATQYSVLTGQKMKAIIPVKGRTLIVCKYLGLDCWCCSLPGGACFDWGWSGWLSLSNFLSMAEEELGLLPRVTTEHLHNGYWRWEWCTGELSALRKVVNINWFLMVTDSHGVTVRTLTAQTCSASTMKVNKNKEIWDQLFLVKIL